MKKSKFTDHQIAFAFKQAETGTPRAVQKPWDLLSLGEAEWVTI